MIVLAGAALVSRLGSAAFIASVVGGQLLCSLILDHYGLMDLAVREVTWGRILGAIMVVLGVLCIKFL
jgi:transporter family-2 protein